MNEINTNAEHYFKDEGGNIHGLFQTWYDSGSAWHQIQTNHGLKHGELKFFHEDGSLYRHDWFEHNKRVLNFLDGDKYPVDEEELLIFKLTYQGEFIPR